MNDWLWWCIYDRNHFKLLESITGDRQDLYEVVRLVYIIQRSGANRLVDNVITGYRIKLDRCSTNLDPSTVSFDQLGNHKTANILGAICFRQIAFDNPAITRPPQCFTDGEF